MIYFFYGNNKEKMNITARKTVFSFGLSEKNIDDQNFDREEFSSLIESRGLFDPILLVVSRNVLADKDYFDFWKQNIKSLADSSNHFIFIEESPSKEIISLFKKHSEKIEEFSLVKPVSKAKFKVFYLGDAFGMRDKKRAWILYIDSIKNNIEAENIHGILFWQIKSMIIASESKNAEESGLNPFVYRKSSSFAKKFEPLELHKLANELVRIYHEARKGMNDMPIALEKFILSSL